MLIGLSTAHLVTPTATAAGVLDALLAAAPDAIEVAAGGPEPLQLALVQALQRRRPGLPLRALEAFAPAGRASGGPALCAPDSAERAAAIARAERSVRLAAELGIGVVVASLGRLAVDTEWATVRARFARDEIDADFWRPYRAERAGRAPAHLDAARAALEPLLRLSERVGVMLALVNRPGYDEAPDASDLQTLRADFAGAPLGTFYDTAAAHVQETLGTAEPRAALAAFGANGCGAHLSDAAGFTRGLPPGVGEVDFAALQGQLPADAPLFVHCAPSSYPREVGEALTRMRELLG